MGILLLFGGSSICETLSRLLLALAVTVGGIAVIQTTVYLLWRYRVNRFYYLQRDVLPYPIPFIPYPSAMVFPGVMLVGISVFLTGIIGSAAAILVSDTTTVCGFNSSVNGTFVNGTFTNVTTVIPVESCACQTLAIIAMVLVAAYWSLIVALLVHFSRNHRRVTWERAAAVVQPSMVADPLFRLVSKMRACICRGCLDEKSIVVDRERGSFQRALDLIVEPARTERLLARPFALFRANSADAVDAFGFSLLARAGGSSGLAISFDVGVITAQLTVGLLNGIGSGLQLLPGSPGAVAQVMAVFLVQVAICLLITCANASKDRVDGTVVGLQFALEAGQTAALLVHAVIPNSALLQASFCLSLSALFVPIVQQLYDAIIVPLSRAAKRKDRISWREAVCEALSLFCLLPKVVLRLLGVKVADSALAIAEQGGESMRKAAVLSHEASHESKVATQQQSSRNLRAVHDDFAPGMESHASLQPSIDADEKEETFRSGAASALWDSAAHQSVNARVRGHQSVNASVRLQAHRSINAAFVTDEKKEALRSSSRTDLESESYSGRRSRNETFETGHSTSSYGITISRVHMMKKPPSTYPPILRQPIPAGYPPGTSESSKQQALEWLEREAKEHEALWLSNLTDLESEADSASRPSNGRVETGSSTSPYGVMNGVTIQRARMLSLMKSPHAGYPPIVRQPTHWTSSHLVSPPAGYPPIVRQPTHRVEAEVQLLRRLLSQASVASSHLVSPPAGYPPIVRQPIPAGYPPATSESSKQQALEWLERETDHGESVWIQDDMGV